MKKISKIALATIITSTISANAGVILDAEVGAGVWNSSPSGTIHYGDNGSNIDLENDLGLESNSNTYLYAYFEHFIPLIPNARVEQQKLKISGTSKPITSLTFNGNKYETKINTDLDLTQNDFTVYWGIPGINLFTAGILDVNFGINLKQFQGHIQLDETLTDTSDKVDLDFFVPMGYLAAVVDVPILPIKFNANYKTISYKDSALRDIMAKVSLELPLPIPLIDFSIDVGYKKQTLSISKDLSDNLNTDIKFEGPFVGLNAKF